MRRDVVITVASISHQRQRKVGCSAVRCPFNFHGLIRDEGCVSWRGYYAVVKDARVYRRGTGARSDVVGHDLELPSWEGIVMCCVVSKLKMNTEFGAWFAAKIKSDGFPRVGTGQDFSLNYIIHPSHIRYRMCS